MIGAATHRLMAFVNRLRKRLDWDLSRFASRARLCFECTKLAVYTGPAMLRSPPALLLRRKCNIAISDEI